MDEYLKITSPGDDYEEMCYYHDINAAADGSAAVGIRNPKAGLGVQIAFNKNELDHFVQWKMLGKGEYVMGLEPGNASIDGRADAASNGSLKLIAPGEEKHFNLNITVTK